VVLQGSQTSADSHTSHSKPNAKANAGAADTGAATANTGAADTSGADAARSSVAPAASPAITPASASTSDAGRAQL
jgi:hypothetical protein